MNKLTGDLDLPAVHNLPHGKSEVDNDPDLETVYTATPDDEEPNEHEKKTLRRSK